MAGSPLHAQPAPNPPTPAQPATPAETVELSPFLVSSAADQGYYSSQTLAGGRVRTELKDVATSVQVVTDVMLEDLGLTNLNDVLAYTTNTDALGALSNYTQAADSVGDGTLSQSEARQDPASANRVRGLAAPTRTTNYFQSDIPFDAYNSGRIDINRGANSLLFGLGSPGGIINNSVSNAEFRDSLKLDFQVSTQNFADNYSRRASVNLNKVIVPKKLALRVAALEDKEEFMQQPAHTDTTRRYGALKFKPSRNTTSFSTRTTNGAASRPSPWTASPHSQPSIRFSTIPTATAGPAWRALAAPPAWPTPPVVASKTPSSPSSPTISGETPAISAGFSTGR